MDKILLVCSSIKGTKVFAEYLKDIGYNNIDAESNGASARRRLSRIVPLRRVFP